MSVFGSFKSRGAGLAVSVLLATSLVAVASPADERRLDPNDIAALSKGGAGAGTSGVAGIQTTVLSGDPTASGPYTIALRVPAHTIIAAHTHRDSRSAVVVSGIWWFGYGPTNTEDKLKALPPGSFYTEPGGEAHFARTGDQAVVVYITGMGPTDTRYVDASAAPRQP
ncbi:cupin domain-containing protein [Bradyrhizobium sp. 2TAF24]|uniref:cupin domain-containing protein n=1 Tax=Bradyrhizobium sp. 2TAF24 TaxID=3233011 RepID=UPI003F9075C9